MQIAIDGPVAAGKGTVAYEVGKKLNILNVDTGAMYRAVTLLAKENKLDLKDEGMIVKLLKKSKISLEPSSKNSPHKCLVFLNGRNITNFIRTPEISRGVSIIATLPKVRKIMVVLQKKIAQNRSVIMEGRDITTRVLPEADLKIFLTAIAGTRAKRRQLELREQGIEKPLDEILKETLERDKRDSTRKTDPLQITKDSWVLDTTRLTINQVVNKILEKVKTLK